MISDYFGYALGDFLLFSDVVYWRLFARANAATWPAPFIAPAAVALAFLAAWARARFRPVIAVALAAAWLTSGVTFLPLYQEINWAVAYITPVFWVQAALLLVWGFSGHAIAASAVGHRRAIGVGLAGAALLIWPLLASAFGRSFATAEVVGIAPDPTVVVTLAALILFARGSIGWLLALAPLVLCAIGITTLLTLGSTEGYVLLATTVCAAVGLTLRR